jgi:hypothetical protein
MDCFAPLAMTLSGIGTQIRVLAALIARGLLEFPALESQRAQGMPDARCTRDLMCNVHKKVRT